MAVRIQLNTGEILRKRGLDKNGAVQRAFTQECAKEMNPYIPYRTGNLKDQDVKINVDSIEYSAEYAEEQYYENEGQGMNGTANGGIRGKQWDKRMWADQGEKIVKKMADMAGGKAK
ncbi:MULTISPECIES: minor capsid protein [Clostridium]|uniref:minor capsid protein n=1 Tax=Clostridium TaxID=1485 RepID=UPI0009CE10CF|nr:MULTISPECIES: minor capsid protein [Clostridium]MBA8937763.1 hypothetical protein [Clostridium beijerinckii]NRU41621.1 hypothetical protein [Clostridium beijerinckii]NSB00835.1 hypothetical protein [Clostridium beijerinckii]OOM52621.1 minor capsid protein [Clostridium beijerinckii]OOM65596.1 minor capsid protein [Clostridium beijerinckii]